MPFKYHFVQSTNIVNSPIEDVWNLISSVDQVEKWHPLVNSCSYDPLTNIRTCNTEQGTLKEDIITIDHPNRTFRYYIREQDIYPTNQPILCTMRFLEGKEGTIFLWDINFKSFGEAEVEAEVQSGFDVLCSSCSRALEDLFPPAEM